MANEANDKEAIDAPIWYPNLYHKVKEKSEVALRWYSIVNLCFSPLIQTSAY